MEGEMPPTKKIKTSDGEEQITIDYRKFKEYMTPVVLQHTEGASVAYFREMCDFLMIPWTSEEDESAWGVFTMTNADRKELMRDFAKLCLNFYNEARRTEFELVKVWKVNYNYYYFLNFTAKEYGVGGPPFLFRGCVHTPKTRALFCEIKENDDVTLLPDDENFSGSTAANAAKD